MKKATDQTAAFFVGNAVSRGLFLCARRRVAGWPALPCSTAAMAFRDAFPPLIRSLLPISGIGHHVIRKPMPATGFLCLARLVDAAELATAFV
ncbi:MAG: hypothetical protein WBD10_14855 [Acidobacteriaceae bacterium]